MSILTEHPQVSFTVPDTFAPAPAEARGVARDGVRLLVADGETARIQHAIFRRLPDFLSPGDLLVVNASQTVAAELDAEYVGRGPVVVHLATPLEDGEWVVELRTAPDAERAILDAESGDQVLVGDVELTLLAPYPVADSSPTSGGNRLWRASVGGDLAAARSARGRPIAYGYLERRYPLADYQTVFGTRPGSAEMPSAGRPFTTAIVKRLLAKGVGVAAITLHTSVSSQEAGEAPLAERFEVPAATAAAVNAAKAAGGRIVAVGTTVTRALESAVDPAGRAIPVSGWTIRVVTPAEPPVLVDGLITGWHDPHASHLLLVEAVAGRELTQSAYDAAVAERYLWHEFGDSALLLPARR